MAVLPALGWRFLRQARYGLPVRSYSPPSGLTMKTMQISRLSTRRVTRGSVLVAVGQPAQDREGLLDRQVLAGVVEAVEQDLGLVLVGRRRCRRSWRPRSRGPGGSCRSRSCLTMAGWSATVLSSSATISA